MSQSEHFDTVILGSGQGGKQLAWHLARSGQKVAVVERRWVGGSCPAVACLPSKNEIWSARVAHLARNAARFGTLTGPIKIDMAKVRGRKQDMIDREIAFHLKAYKESGAKLIMGSGRFVEPKTIEVALNDGGMRLLTGKEAVINVGSHAAIPNIPGLEAARALTHIEALELDYVPAHLIVLGGGYIGVEMAQAYRRFGSRVTIIEPGYQLMSREDADVATEMQRVLTGEDIEILLDAQPVNVHGLSGDEVSVTIHTASGERTITGSDLLVATGRIPNTADIGLEQTGVELDARGFIRVNERLETTASGVWAIGECAGSPQFTHVSVDDFRIVRDNMAGGNRRTDERLVPYVMFTDPPLARVGLSEGEAQRKNIPVRVANADGQCVADGSDGRNRGLHESACECDGRQDIGIHHDRLRGGRGNGCGSDGDAGGTSIYADARCGYYPSDNSRRAGTAPRRHPSTRCRLDHAAKQMEGGQTSGYSRRSID
ncbi:pyruvate/2-oxoglutarate dehydrogenase complex dihydrolipoamide dehydrogenase (E3) component [Phyllobacterium trifolii]|uniref:Pyruvate/2-oxoglutarate dehydrogenase complex dihydrolipoamide dehydrogenase (E3) component n=1 Tax=Phyllobacterium trifolii TaxID=300193 RepID=A0A839U5I2_9HYPH|nr:pyruvate/2-oxoglutarate dehydrogenase complex dihydrolipoamide dehydrogenase (E3) component [Phyllobacterium trifolii]